MKKSLSLFDPDISLFIRGPQQDEIDLLYQADDKEIKIQMSSTNHREERNI